MGERVPDSGSDRVLFQCTKGISRDMMCGEVILPVNIISRKISGNPVASFTGCFSEIVPLISRRRQRVWELKYLQVIPEHTDKNYVTWLERYMLFVVVVVGDYIH